MKKCGSQIQIREFPDIHGDFYSKFDLHDFPNDIQEINISTGSVTKFIKEFLFRNGDDELDALGRERKRSILIIACHAITFIDIVD
ncbi:unnamed protein product [Rotaria sordida]|uniref:Uncharacterized protein n=1 Tax=Rotaria sordida TaxID=392033 RepID=A0A819FQG9_9BILA|nr:unnamed protein product [Rotaria sordida]CAF3871275.1 unnamed protein product [Rotaria sordida]